MVMIVGWTLLVSSWLVKFVIKDEEKRQLIGIILSAIAFGVFIGGGLSKISL